MHAIDSAAIVGLGLIGGSLARDLAARGVRVLGADRERSTVEAAAAEGVVEALAADFAGIEDASVVVLAVPVTETPALVEALAARSCRARLVMDLGSTKRTTVAAAAETPLGDRFVGAHPLAGDHRSGWSASRAGLFSGARVFLSPAPQAGEDAIGLAIELWSAVGAAPEAIEPGEHDRLLARTSHVHQVAATALGLAMAAEGIPRRELGPGGETMTRLAGSSPEMWGAVCADNGPLVGEAVAVLQQQIARLAAALDRGDPEELRALFAGAREWFDGGGRE
ncbi:MAG: prephenate dehydrogenase [Thermoanaerobaculia bacterium]